MMWVSSVVLDLSSCSVVGMIDAGEGKKLHTDKRSRCDTLCKMSLHDEMIA